MIVLGAGPAGLFCGLTAVQNGEQVVVLEKNSQPGMKLRMSGSGQCNLTHGGSIDSFLNHFGGKNKSRFVKPALFAFPNTEIIRFFEQCGVPLFEREDGKIFPRSLKSGDILRVMLNELKRHGGECRTGVHVFAVKQADNGFCVETNQGTFSTNRLTIATGGCSYPVTGSTGDGYRWAEQWKHRIVPPRPALTHVLIEMYPFADASGISFDNVPIEVYRQGKKICQGQGDVLLTHHGLSGPGILDLSRFLKPQDTLRLPISRNVAEFDSLFSGKKRLKNALIPLGIPERLLLCLLTALDISPETSASEMNRRDRQRLQRMISAYPFVIKRLGGFEEAMATSGGVALEGVNRQTMESRLVSGLFFCGEVLDIDGDTGGYNIQFALSSGFLAGKMAYKSSKEQEA